MQEKTIKERINELYNSLSPACRKVAKYVNDNYQDCLLLSSSELAKAAKVSHTAVIRYTRALGFSGFLEYKKALKDEYIPKQKVYSYLNKMQAGDDGGYISSYFHTMRADMEKFLSALNTDILDRFCSHITAADTVYIMGIGSDTVIVDFLRNYLVLMGIRVIPVYEEGLALREKLFHINEHDALFMIAYPSMMDDERWASDFARKKKADLLVITDSELTAKTLHADTFACMAESSDTFFNSYILPLAFCNALLLRLYEKNQEDVRKSVEDYQSAIR